MSESQEAPVLLHDFTEQSYLNYSMYVILDRALPALADGLKPVQRRIVYAMSELGLKHSSKPKKAARTVGDVLGKFHPHGDSACYEAMVLMAQPFSFRYPLVEGQGNWGVQDFPKSFAAMRYTEARLSAYAHLLLQELGQGTVDWQDNFDGTLQEPRLLPVRVPNVLLNGGSGIAVGMATDIPAHNLRELCQACILLLESSRSTLEEVMTLMPGPDFSADCECINSQQERLQIYRTGHGSFRLRALMHHEDRQLIVTGLPYQVSGAKVIEQIAAQVLAKKLPMVIDIQDESDHEFPTRIVLSLKARIDGEALMAHLYATTDLEKSVRVNMNMIGLDGAPRCYGLLELLQEWLSYRQGTVRRRLQHRLGQVKDRLEILDGLLIAYLNIDEVIAIIREYDDPKTELIQRFQLSERQAEAILNIRLRQLAKLEEIELKAEQNKLEAERKKLERILASDRRIKTLIRKELEADMEAHGDARRTRMVERGAARALDESQLLPAEAITVILSQQGWARLAKGHDIDPDKLSFKTGDALLCTLAGRSHDPLLFFDEHGRTYSCTASELPSARGHGNPLSGQFDLPSGSRIVHAVMGQNNSRWLLTMDGGYGFVCVFERLLSRLRAGKQVVNLLPDNQLLPPLLLPNADNILLALASRAGRLLLFPVHELAERDKGRGTRLMQLSSTELGNGADRICAVCLLPAGSALLVHSGQRRFTLNDSDQANYLSQRGRRGRHLPRGLQKVQRLLAISP